MFDICIVEDNPELIDVLERFLLHEGYRICCATNGKEALLLLQKQDIRLLLVDIMLPDMDGFHICEQARKHGNLPIVIMSARTQDHDKLLGYTLGADDYVEKPFSMPILLAKIKALLKRGYEMQRDIRYLMDDDLQVDIRKHQVSIQQVPIALSNKEFELLVVLLKHKHTTLTKEFLFKEIWGDISQSSFSTLTVHINTLREKIEKDAKHPCRLVTIWGVGYRYEGVE